MDILVLSWRDPKHPMSGGAEQVMHQHMQGWVEGGHTVTLFSSYYKGGKREEILDGIHIKRYGFQLLGVQVLAFLWYYLSKHPKYNIVVDQFHGIPFFTPFYLGVKKVAVVQEVAREVWLLNQLPKPLNKIIGYLGYFLEPIIFKFYYFIPIITGSESAKEDVYKMGIPSKNITVINHGVILDIPKKLPSLENKKTLIFLGVLTRDKGIEEALKTFSILKSDSSYQFWVVGKAGHGYDLVLEKLVNTLDLQDRVKFWGFVSQRKKFELLAKSHLLINPSFREGWGLVNIEANSVGTPVIAYNSQGLTDSVQNEISGVICKINSPHELVANIEKVLQDDKAYSAMRKSSIKWSKNFSWENSKKQSLDLITKVVYD